MNKKNTNITTENKTIKDTNKISLDISIETIKLELENKFLTFPLWDKQIIGSKLLPII